MIGGALTTNVSWRWCFYINLPIGGFTIIALFLTLKAPPPKHTVTFKKQLAQLDIIGTSIFILCIVCLLLALQWGGSTYPWSDGRVIALLVLFGVLLIAFAAVQAWKKESIVPLRVIKQRSVAAGLLYTICIGSAMSLMVYYLPLWFQAIKVRFFYPLQTFRLPLTRAVGCNRSEIRYNDCPLRPRRFCQLYLRRRLHPELRLLCPFYVRMRYYCPYRDGPLYDLPNRHRPCKMDRLPGTYRPRYRAGHTAEFYGSSDMPADY